MAQKIKFLRKTSPVAGYAAALAAAKAKNPAYGEPLVVKYTEDTATKLAFFVGIDGAGAVFEVGTFNAIAEVKTALTDLTSKVGDVADLTTTNKASLVNAINELKTALDTTTNASVTEVVAGAGVNVDKTDAHKPVVSAKVATAQADNILVVDETNGLYATIDMAYDPETGALTLTGSNNVEKSVNIIIPAVVKSGRYDATTNEIVLVLDDDSEIKIPASGLIDEWTVASTQSLELIRDTTGQPAGVTTLKGNVKVSATTGNQLVLNADGLFVAATDLTPLTNRVTALETTVGDATSGLVKDVNDLKAKAGATLENIEAGNGIAVTAKANQKQTVSAKVDNTSIVIEGGNLAVGVVDGGEF